MALQLTFEHPAGLTVTDAYHKLIALEVRAMGMGCTVIARVATYKDKPTADAEGVPFEIRNFVMTSFDKSLDSVSAAGQVYAWLKTLPDFAAATDI